MRELANGSQTLKLKVKKARPPIPSLPPCLCLLIRVADPDPDWIRIQSGQWIRIRIRNPYPGGQKLPTKVENFFKSSSFEVLDGLF